MTTFPDVLVVGLGAMGAATLLHASGQGASVLGLDRFTPPHTHGSTHGESRITRLAIGEGADYVPLAKRSHQLWRALEADTGESLYHACGGLIMSGAEAVPMHGQSDFFANTVAVAKQHSIDHRLLNASEIEARWPQFQLSGDERGYFEPEAGYLRPEACVSAQLAAAKARGAKVRFGETLLSWSQDARGLQVQTDRNVYRPGVAVFCVGAWLPGLLRTRVLRVTRQVLHWFDAKERSQYQPDQFPIFIWNWGAAPGQSFYGFPDLGNGIKVAAENQLECDPDQVDRTVGIEDSETVYRTHIATRLRGLSNRSIRDATCLYTEAPGARFIIDRLGAQGPLIVSACSGHGFKHSAAIGEAVAAWARTSVRPEVLAPFTA